MSPVTLSRTIAHDAAEFGRASPSASSLVYKGGSPAQRQTEEHMNAEDAWKARAESEETVSWEDLRKELDL